MGGEQAVSRESLTKAMAGVLVGLACMIVALSAPMAASAAGSPHRAGAFSAKPPRGSARVSRSIGHGRGHGVIYFAGSKQADAVKVDCSASCVGPLFYHGGPVMHTPAAYTIYWEPTVNLQVGTSFTKFPASYRSLIDGFMEDVSGTSTPLDNAFSVDQLYGDSGASGSYGWKFGGGFLDTATLPIRDKAHCPEASPEEETKEAKGEAGLPPAGQPCVTDTQLQEQLEEFVKSQSLPGGLGALYFVITPEHLNSCAGGEGERAECTTNVFCAYHSDFPVSASRIVYANMPFARRPGCLLPDEPHGEAADDEIDVISHEGNEAITDPLVQEGEPHGWFDYFGQEIADKCTYPFFEPLIDFSEELDAYGPLLGGSPGTFGPKGELLTQGSAYNQSINGGHYMLQREWSDPAGGCVARAPVPAASFAVYSSPGVAGQAISFNGSASMTPAGKLLSYTWDFGDGSAQVAGPQPTHAYASPGTYSVTLTVTNNSGASASTTQSVSVVAPAPAPEPVVLTKTVSVLVPVEPTAYTASQLASKLGLPANRAKIFVSGSIAVGHAQCPPACTVSIRLYAIKHVTVHGRRMVKRVFVGALTATVADKGSSTLTLTLNAAGRKLLGRSHKLPAQLVVSVTGKEGGSWQITRTLTLTSSGKAARRGRA
jgi:PKD repeat protein